METWRFRRHFFHGALNVHRRMGTISWMVRTRCNMWRGRSSAGDAGREVLVGIGDAPIVLFLVFVLIRCRGWDRDAARRLNELVALFIVGELHEVDRSSVGDDPAHVLIQPIRYVLLNSILRRLALLFSLRVRIGRLKRIVCVCAPAPLSSNHSLLYPEPAKWRGTPNGIRPASNSHRANIFVNLRRT